MKPSRVAAAIVLGLIGLIVLFLALPRPVYAVHRDFFVKTTGGGTNCLQASPCSLATALGKVNDGDTIYVAGGTYIGSGANTNVITLTNSIHLYGGWDGAPSGNVVRNPTTHPTTLDGQRQRRVIRITGDVTPTIDGFIITRGDATGLTSDCVDPNIFNSDGCGGGILVHSGHPIISDNIITDNIAVITSTGVGKLGYGGGILLINADRTIISGNMIISNAATMAHGGHGGGIEIVGSSTELQINANQVLNNFTDFSNTVGWGGGIALESTTGSGLRIENNRIQGNDAGLGFGAGLYIWASAGRIVSNHIISNSGDDAVFIGFASDGSSRFRNNWILDNIVNYGLDIEYGTDLIATNNVIDVGTNDDAIYVNGASGEPVTVTLKHNTLHGAGTGTGIYLKNYASVWLTNTIISNFSVGITNTVPASSDAHAYYSLMNSNPIDFGPNIVRSGTIFGVPRFINAAANDFHIVLDSDALNAGLGIGVTDDIDSETRPMRGAPDIGADEVPYYVSLPLVLKNH